MSHKEQRDRLWQKQKGKCHWCQVPMIKNPGSKPDRPNVCTLDHLDNRLSESRGMFSSLGIKRRVAACYKCNQTRSAEAVEWAKAQGKL